MRNRSSRSFTVENKSGGRNQRTLIPHRATAPATPRPAVSWPSPAERHAPAAESRRILPSLIEPAPAQPERMQVSTERSPKPRRGRPPKGKLVAAEVVKEPIAGPAIDIAPPPAPRMPIAQVMRAAKTPATLPPGERWKRRFGRWAQ